MEKKRVLIVEDEVIPANYLKKILEDNDYDVLDIVNKGCLAIEKAKVLKPDLILMDIMLKDNISGCEAGIEIRREQKEIALVYLTSHVQKEMVELAKESQANAYLLKPYRAEEIIATLAMIFAHEKNEKFPKEEDKISLSHNFSYSLKEQKLFKNNQSIPLNKKRQKLIELLVKNRNNTVSNEQISVVVWGEFKGVNTLRSLIFRTKKFLEEELIVNVNGVGYMVKTQA
jgi:DNA-binding response OmpR family regulator